MKKTTTFALVALVLAVLAFFLSRIIWPDPEGGAQPSSSLLPYFMAVGVLEAVAFGIGMALLFVYWQQGIKRWPVFLSIVWLLISWWPHDNYHRVLGENFLGLIILEYVFHVTLIVAGFVLAHDFVRRWSVASDATVGGGTAV